MKREMLTKSERRIYGIIIDYIEDHRFAPTYRELLELSGYSSLSTIHEKVNHLISKGFIEMEPGRPRTLRISGLQKNTG